MTPYETSHLKERKKNTRQGLKKKKSISVSIYLPCIYDLPVCVSTQLSICHFCVSVSLCLFLSSHHLCIYHLIIYLFFFFFLSVYSPYSLSPKRYFWLCISLVEHMLHCSIVGCFICLINLILYFPSVQTPLVFLTNIFARVWFQADSANHCERMKNLTGGKAELFMLRKHFLFFIRKVH